MIYGRLIYGRLIYGRLIYGRLDHRRLDAGVYVDPWALASMASEG